MIAQVLDDLHHRLFRDLADLTANDHLVRLPVVAPEHDSAQRLQGSAVLQKLANAEEDLPSVRFGSNLALTDPVRDLQGVVTLKPARVPQVLIRSLQEIVPRLPQSLVRTLVLLEHLLQILNQLFRRSHRYSLLS